MIKQDYLLKQIEELGKVLSELTSLRKHGNAARKYEIIEQSCEIFGLDKNKILSFNSLETIEYLKSKGIYDFNLVELIAGIVFEESFMRTNSKEKNNKLQDAYELLVFVDKNSKCFSFERQIKMDEILLQIQKH